MNFGQKEIAFVQQQIMEEFKLKYDIDGEDIIYINPVFKLGNYVNQTDKLKKLTKLKQTLMEDYCKINSCDIELYHQIISG